MPLFVLEEVSAAVDGAGPAVPLGGEQGNLLILTLVITRIIEREGIQISVWGSADGTDWGLTPVALFTPKYYCGIYSVRLNLVSRPDIRYLCAHWHLKRSQTKDDQPIACGFYVSAETSSARFTAVA
jgi:hypothetical protein